MASSGKQASLKTSLLNWKHWWREPLLHFILIGAALFIVYSRFAKPVESSDTPQAVSRRISVGESKMKELMKQFQQNEGRLPSHAELTKLADDWVREEVLYRAGLLEGVDRNDPVIRQRLVKLMQWYLTGASGGEPSEAELRKHFTANEERYRGGGGLLFEQVFFSTTRRGETALTDAKMTLNSFQAGRQTAMEVAIGHGDSLGGDKSQEVLQSGKPEELATRFGLPFVAMVQNLPFNRWSGPYQSLLGWHVVRHLKASEPVFEELRMQIRSEVMTARGSASPDGAYNELRKRYEVEMAELPEVRK